MSRRRRRSSSRLLACGSAGGGDCRRARRTARRPARPAAGAPGRGGAGRRRRRCGGGAGRIGSLRLLLLLAARSPSSSSLAPAAAFAGLMFVSTHDALLLASSRVYAGVVGAPATRPVAEGVIRDIATVRDGLDAVGVRRAATCLDGARRGELGDLARSAAAMAGRLNAQEEARRRLFTAVSHDLRTPITSLTLLADGLRDEVIPPEERAATLDRMAVHLRALSGADRRPVRAVAARGGRGHVVDAARAAATARRRDDRRHAARRRGEGRRGARADGGRPRAGGRRSRAPPARALQPDPERHPPYAGGRHVTVFTEPVGDRLEVEVADTGPGIAADERERVFEPFPRRQRRPGAATAARGSAWRSRARSSRRTAGGSGSSPPTPARASASACRRAR